jgi:putative FmdB family regulatory protein
MPLYDFKCLDCKKTFEIVRAIESYDAQKVQCPKCGSKNVERQWTGVFVETSKKS